MSEDNQSSVQVGDIVGLHSGGVRMTVKSLFTSDDGIKKARCVWHDNEGKPHEEDYNIDCLTDASGVSAGPGKAWWFPWSPF